MRRPGRGDGGGHPGRESCMGATLPKIAFELAFAREVENFTSPRDSISLEKVRRFRGCDRINRSRPPFVRCSGKWRLFGFDDYHFECSLRTNGAEVRRGACKQCSAYFAGGTLGSHTDAYSRERFAQSPRESHARTHTHVHTRVHIRRAA